MLTAERNRRMTEVGPGTPMGNLLRRYWQPIAAGAEMPVGSSRPITLLGEELVLYRMPAGHPDVGTPLTTHVLHQDTISWSGRARSPTAHVSTSAAVIAACRCSAIASSPTRTPSFVVRTLGARA